MTTDTPFTLSEDTLFLVVRALVADELKALRHLDDNAVNPEQWHSGTRIKGTAATPQDPAGSLHADSLEIMALATHINSFFQIHRSGIEDYLLRYTSLGEWTELVAKSRDMGHRDITFATSGSTGEPKHCDHAWDTLVDEVDFFLNQFEATLGQPLQRVIALSPPQHIYGFLFSVLLPARAGLPTLRGQQAMSLAWRGDFAAGDLILGFPFLWQQLSRQRLAFPEGTLGVTSTGPCETDVIASLTNRGLSAMVEIYGASETAGIGWRTAPRQPFALLPRWQRSQQTPEQLLDATSGKTFSLGDHLHWQGERLLTPSGRKDHAVQVGGINVFPEHIATRLKTLPDVADARVRLMRPEEGGRLKAFVVPANDAPDPMPLRATLDSWCEQNLTPPERPKAFTFGPALPVNAMNKATNWDIRSVPTGSH